MLDEVRGPATRIRKTSYFTTKVTESTEKIQKSAFCELAGLCGLAIIGKNT